jgi:hypothetical protein
MILQACTLWGIGRGARESVAKSLGTAAGPMHCLRTLAAGDRLDERLRGHSSKVYCRVNFLQVVIELGAVKLCGDMSAPQSCTSVTCRLQGCQPMQSRACWTSQHAGMLHQLYAEV